MEVTIKDQRGNKQNRDFQKQKKISETKNWFFERRKKKKNQPTCGPAHQEKKETGPK